MADNNQFVPRAPQCNKLFKVMLQIKAAEIIVKVTERRKVWWLRDYMHLTTSLSVIGM